MAWIICLTVALDSLELTGPDDDRAVGEHVFNLLALVLEREPVHIASLAFDSSDMYLRGTALEYLRDGPSGGHF